MTVPIITKSGPIAATISPIITTICLAVGLKLFNQVAIPPRTVATPCKIGPKTSEIASPKLPNASLALLLATLNLSIPSSVASNVLSTTSPYSDILFDKSSIENLPSLIALVISAAPLVPKILVAIVSASVSLPAFFIDSIVFLRASSIESPSLV